MSELIRVDSLTSEDFLSAAYLNDQTAKVTGETIFVEINPDRSIAVDDYRYNLTLGEVQLLSTVALLPRGAYAPKQVFFDAGFAEDSSSLNSRNVRFSRGMTRLRKVFADFGEISYLRKQVRYPLGYYSLSAAITFVDDKVPSPSLADAEEARQAFLDQTGQYLLFRNGKPFRPKSVR